MADNPRDGLAGTAEETATVLAKHAAEVDREARFPVESLEALRDARLMGLLVPVEYGGGGGTAADLLIAARRLATGCMSSALIWAMHCQQVAALARYASRRLAAEVLPEIADRGLYLASVTTERRRGADLVEVEAPLVWHDDAVDLVRSAPVVTGGEHADAFLVTMRRDAHRDLSDVVLVFAHRSQLDVTRIGEWDTMGVRGTASVPLELTGSVPHHQIVDPPGGFAEVARVAMVPFGHVAWAACWLGAAEGALRDLVRHARDPRTRGQVGRLDEQFDLQLGRVRAHLEIADAVLDRYVRDLDARWQASTVDGFDDAAFRVRTNNVKVIVSEAAFAAVEGLLQVAGLRLAYSRNGPLPLERAYRDLRSASMMVPNQRLLAINGKLALFAQSPS